MKTPTADIAQWNRMSLELSAMFAVELRALLGWKLGVLCLLGGALTFCLAFLMGVNAPLFGAGWFTIAVLQIILLGVLSQSVREVQIWRWALACAFSLIAWWALANACGIVHHSISPLVPALLLLLLGSLPWPFRYSLVLVLVFMLSALASSLISDSPVVLLVLVLAAVPIALRSSAVAHLNQISRLSGVVILRCFEASPAARDVVRNLSVEFCRVADSGKVLILSREGAAELISSGVVEVPVVDNIYALGLSERIEQTGDNEGIILSSELDEQFLGPLLDWFGALPWGIFHVSLPAMADGREERIQLVVPLRDCVKLAGVHRTMSALVELSAVVRIALAAQRTRHLSADALVATQQSASEQEHDLNQIIHHVNNSAQDIAMVSEELRKAAAVLPGEAETAMVRTELLSQAERLEGSSRSLSAEVSDVKLLRELLSRRESGRIIEVNAGELVDELRSYGRQRAYRKGFEFSVDADLPAAIRVQTGSREFLETCLRLLIRLAGSHVGKNGRVFLRARLESGHFLLEILDDGKPLEQIVREALLHSVTYDRISGSALKYFWAAGDFLRSGGGHVSFPGPGEGAVNRIMISLVCVERSPEAAVERGGWILLVDDNPEVTIFYSRVAEALNLTHFTAASCDEAQKILDERGRPRLVITDLQLGAGSGLVLLQDLRRRYGEQLPVIVVSGNSDGGLVEKTMAAGATRYLTKPVGRRKLFAEIREILAGS